jgi:hypothetical protein
LYAIVYNILELLDVTMAWKEISAICLVSIVIMMAVPAVSASKATLPDLLSTISSFDDPRMDVQDLAFYLATHDFDASPKDGYVEVSMDCSLFKLVPNGSAPGLCSVTSC